MKKIILASAVFFSVNFIQAQKLDVRIYGGTNVLQLTTDQGTEIIDGVMHNKTVSGRAGYQFGAAVTFGERFYVQPGLQYTEISTKIQHENSKTAFKFEDHASIKLISVPLHVGYRLLPTVVGKIVNVRIFGGISGHHVIGVNHSGESGKVTEISKDDYTNLMMNADFGMGVDVWHFFLDATYALGLTPIHATAGDAAKANSFMLNLGFKIGF